MFLPLQGGKKGNLLGEGSQISSESLMRNPWSPHSRGEGRKGSCVYEEQPRWWVVCCKIVILWLGCHGNSMGWVSHVPLLCVIFVAAGWCAQGQRRWGGRRGVLFCMLPFLLNKKELDEQVCFLWKCNWVWLCILSMREALNGPERLLNEVECVTMVMDYARLWFCFPLQAHAGKCHCCNRADAVCLTADLHLY